jgi:rhodanese-related sulfurtransferase
MKSMKNSLSVLLLAIAFGLSGCQFQKPDYVRMVKATELQNLLQREDIFLVDVHTPEQRHIQGTDLFMPYDAVEQYQDRLPQDKSTPLYIYCEGGPMGNAAAKSLHALGYTNLNNLEGGAKAWRAAGFPFD